MEGLCAIDDSSFAEMPEQFFLSPGMIGVDWTVLGVTRCSMSAQQAGALLDHIRRLAGGGDLDPLTDQELLSRYAAGDEAAFAALVRRHGPMVWHVCRRALRQAQDAEDVFQATFLVLARKAGTVRWRPSVAPWLYAVAQRLVNKARSLAGRPLRPLPVPRPSPDPLEELTARDL